MNINTFSKMKFISRELSRLGFKMGWDGKAFQINVQFSKNKPTVFAEFLTLNEVILALRSGGLQRAWSEMLGD